MGKPGIRRSTSSRMSKRSVGIGLTGLELELVRAVRGADGDGQAVHAGLLHEVLHVVRVCVVGFLRCNLVFDAGQHAQLTLHGHVVGVGELHDLLRELDVLLVGVGRAVDHDRGESAFDARNAQLVGVAVVEVKGNRDGDDLRP